MTGSTSDLSVTGVSGTDTFSTGSATTKGGFIYASNVDSINLDNVKFSYATATDGMIIYIATANSVTLSYSTLQCLQSNTLSSSNTNYKSGSSNYGSAIYADTVTSFTSDWNTITNCYYAAKGGAIYLKSSTFTDSSSTFTNNGAIRGGTIYAADSVLTITSVAIIS